MGKNSNQIVVLVPAYNEESSIGATLQALGEQTRLPDAVVVIPNGCSDHTAEVARDYPVLVMELPALKHKKAEALNTAWDAHARNADIVVCLDADTNLPPNAIADWEKEFQEDRAGLLGGSSSKFTMQAPDFLSRLQKSEFATWTDTSLRRGQTSVLAGTGAAIRGQALREVSRLPDREGPWHYGSQVEDFELTYQIRKLGYYCQVSPTVRAYTDSMKTIHSLWNQRMKWQVGTVEDLLRIGLNPLTRRDWGQQVMGLFGAFLKMLWLVVIFGSWMVLGEVQFIWIWWVLPILFVALDVKRAMRIPHVDRWDILIALVFLPNEFFSWLRSGWFIRSWLDVLVSKITGQRKDRWNAQYAAEGVN